MENAIKNAATESAKQMDDLLTTRGTQGQQDQGSQVLTRCCKNGRFRTTFVQKSCKLSSSRREKAMLYLIHSQEEKATARQSRLLA